MTRLMVFSDLDGTLLDHDDYSFDAARPALDLLKRRGIPLILATSKTAAEVALLHRAMGLGTLPAIVENGAGVYRPGEDAAQAGDHARIRATLDALDPALRTHFTGFADMQPAEIARLTGLPKDRAALARTRCHSEPGLWHGDADAQAAFLAALRAQGIHARHGGRFLTLSLGRTKADGMRTIAAQHNPDRTIALGDAPNDTDMLEAADFGVIVRNDHAPEIPTLAGESAGRIIRTALPGPQGWNAAVTRLVTELQDPED